MGLQYLEIEEEKEKLMTDTSEKGKKAPMQQPEGEGGGSNWVLYVGAAICLMVLHFGGFADKFKSEQPATTAATPEKTTTPAAVVKPTPTSSSNAALEPEKPLETAPGLPKYSELSKIPANHDHKVVTDEIRESLTEKWGKWKFWDGEEDNRPEGDYCAPFPNRDIPGDQFPDDAWQVDAVFVNHYLNDAENLLTRAQEAIFTEMGNAKPLPPEGLAARLKMFKWDVVDLETSEPPHKVDNIGGWTTDSSYNGLVRRLLHAMMTSDTFTVVLAGHSAAAGHGNHFHQSYVHQFHAVMAPVFARLGVKLVTRNMGMGGLGTIQHSLGFNDIYGSDIDLVIWDSGMTERSKSSQSLFARQALLSPGKIPVIWGLDNAVLTEIYKQTGADVGNLGSGMGGVPTITSKEHAETVPYALRYMKCSREAQEICTEAPRFCATCWIERDDIDTSDWPPIQKQPGSQVSWHPGWRVHQLKGHVLAFSILDALQTAVQTWSEGTMGGPPLDDDEWHVTGHFEAIREKLKASDVGMCGRIHEMLTPRVCQLTLHGATQHTPRNDPAHTGLSALIKPDSTGYVPFNNQKMLYDLPDVPNQCYDVPDSEPDLWAIISGRRRLEISAQPLQQRPSDAIPKVLPATSSNSRSLQVIQPGKGWELTGEAPGYCDGEYNSMCGRLGSCPLYGHHDSRGILSGTGLSGWLAFNIPRVEHGFILLKIYTWMKPSDVSRTKEWTTVNNERGRNLRSPILNATNVDNDFDEAFAHSNGRRLGNPWQYTPDNLVFEYSINGKVTSLPLHKFKEVIIAPARVVQLVQILDNPDFPASDNVELAVRITGCGNDCVLTVTHLYWA